MSTSPEPAAPAPRHKQFTVSTMTIALGGALLVLLIAAGVALGIAGWQSGEILGFLTSLLGLSLPLLVAVEKLINLGQSTRDQDGQLGAIRTSLNGEMDARMRANIRQVLADLAAPADRQRPPDATPPEL